MSTETNIYLMTFEELTATRDKLAIKLRSLVKQEAIGKQATTNSKVVETLAYAIDQISNLMKLDVAMSQIL